MPERYWIETLGCPKNEVDSAKLAGLLASQGLRQASSPSAADVIVVNTCAFIEPARAESIETILDLASRRRAGSRLVVTGCLAERHGAELAAEMPEIDLVAGFGQPLIAAGSPAVPVALGPSRAAASGAVGSAPAVGNPAPAGGFDLLELPRPPATAPWAYVKIAEGCDRACGFCAIPSFRGKQRSRSVQAILAEVESLSVREVVLVAQDLGSFGRDESGAAASAGLRDGAAGVASPGRVASRAGAEAPIVGLVRAVSEMVDRVRVLYLYPTALTQPLIEAIVATGLPYFDLSLQHASGRLLRGMRRPGDGRRFLERIAHIRALAPGAVFRSSFIVGYPGETEEDHDTLVDFLQHAELDWAGFFAYSEEPGTPAAALPGKVARALVADRLAECGEIQDRITAQRRAALVGRRMEVLVDAPGVGRSYREAPEIDGVVRLPRTLRTGEIVRVVATGSEGPDLSAHPGPGGDTELVAAESDAAAKLVGVL